MKRVWLILACVVLLFGLIVYIYLGGFNEPEFSIVTIPAYSITGKVYEGPLNVKEFGNRFSEADSLLASGVLKGKSAGVFYNQPEKALDTVKTFIGVLTQDTTVPKGFTRRYFPEREMIRAVLKAHYMLMPVNIYPKIYDYAHEKDLPITSESTEIYASNQELIIQIPLKR